MSFWIALSTPLNQLLILTINPSANPPIHQIQLSDKPMIFNFNFFDIGFNT
jgi:hypothetical protein